MSTYISTNVSCFAICAFNLDICKAFEMLKSVGVMLKIKFKNYFFSLPRGEKMEKCKFKIMFLVLCLIMPRVTFARLTICCIGIYVALVLTRLLKL